MIYNLLHNRGLPVSDLLFRKDSISWYTLGEFNVYVSTQYVRNNYWGVRRRRSVIYRRVKA